MAFSLTGPKDYGSINQLRYLKLIRILKRKYLLYRLIKILGNLESQNGRWDIFSRLYGIYRLPANADGHSEFLLCYIKNRALSDAEGFFVACGNRAGEGTPRLRRVSTSQPQSLARQPLSGACPIPLAPSGWLRCFNLRRKSR